MLIDWQLLVFSVSKDQGWNLLLMVYSIWLIIVIERAFLTIDFIDWWIDFVNNYGTLCIIFLIR